MMLVEGTTPATRKTCALCVAQRVGGLCNAAVICSSGCGDAKSCEWFGSDYGRRICTCVIP